MSHPQPSATAPPTTAAPAAPPSAAAPAPTPSPPRTVAWREAAERLRAAAVTEPGRLRVIGAVLAALLVVLGTVTAWQVAARASAADAVVHHSQPLSAAAADIYRSLADADSTAASGFLAGGQEPRKVRERYDADITLASESLVKAAANTDGSGTARDRITELNKKLPQYTALVEAARANNRQGLPLGGAYLRYASDQMRDELLPAASKLYDAETGRLHSDYADAKSWPWAALGLGVLTLAALGWAQQRTFLRTNRVFNQGLLAATGATTVVLLWLAVGHGVARSELQTSYAHGAHSLQVLTETRIAALKARSNENLTLVARGAIITKGNHDFYEDKFGEGMHDLIGSGGGDPAPDSLLGRALALADDEKGRAPVASVIKDVREWQSRHGNSRSQDESGDYRSALKLVIGEQGNSQGSTGETFDSVDEALNKALKHEQGQFDRAADDGRGALSGLAAGAAVLAVLAAAGAVLGIGRRLSEYR
ncbi:hypothetical protein [Streptomyces sp. UNOC14_S4]|uniref:hypothetical protein n=1 Tax=Streptomyces sp. UNOC14_S4 TaxID=2872340 RepID=UPI001E546650|nr:hypothetical protein [Streptomyces sp. UNOC14_S4]MCC3768334.1 hypothetical protein [Streptomyces sp. UNOC14_S4]